MSKLHSRSISTLAKKKQPQNWPQFEAHQPHLQEYELMYHGYNLTELKIPRNLVVQSK